MILKTTLLSIVLSTGIFSGANNIIFNNAKTISEVKNYESNVQGTEMPALNVTLKPTAFTGIKTNLDCQVLVFKHQDDSGFKPACVSKYFFTSPAQPTKIALYEWNVKNDITNLRAQGFKIEQQLKRENEYTEHYQNLLDKLTAEYGLPAHVLPLNTYGTEVKAQAIWHLVDRDVTLDLVFSKVLTKYADSTVDGNFKVSLKIDFLGQNDMLASNK
jgi:hypothetical protein